MLLAYLDESDSPKRYFVAGVLVPDTEARSLTAALDGVVEEASYEHGRIASSEIRLDKRYPDGHDHPHSVVLTHLIERVDEYAERVGQNALLIADEVAEQDSYRRDLWQYQRSATWGYRQRQITRVIDTLHFAPSHSSRLVQAADLVAFLARRIATHTETDPRAKQEYATMWKRIEPKVWHQHCWVP